MILVGYQGRLVGLVTVKDVLRHETEIEQEHAAHLLEEQGVEERVGLEGVLDEAWLWVTGLFSSARRGDGPGELDAGRRETSAFDYELADRPGEGVRR